MAVGFWCLGISRSRSGGGGEPTGEAATTASARELQDGPEGPWCSPPHPQASLVHFTCAANTQGHPLHPQMPRGPQGHFFRKMDMWFLTPRSPVWWRRAQGPTALGKKAETHPVALSGWSKMFPVPHRPWALRCMVKFPVSVYLSHPSSKPRFLDRRRLIIYLQGIWMPSSFAQLLGDTVRAEATWGRGTPSIKLRALVGGAATWPVCRGRDPFSLQGKQALPGTSRAPSYSECMRMCWER